MADLFSLRALLTLDSSGYESGLTKAEKQASVFASVLKANLITKGVEVCIKGLSKLGGAAARVFNGAIESYAEYEQLVGGVETLFGGSAQKVIEDAQAAYKTAGMSANQYMETSIQSAASLINSLGGDQKKAAELMNMSIVDMSDNVNKMGTNMDSVQNAYRGFSRGNFTMLDNLALGFSGTKEGMQQLLDKAQKLSGVKYDISSYADIVQAIHVVQTEIGITGTTAKEASDTIEGSLNSLKAAWSNLITGIGKGNKKDIKKLIDDVVKSLKTYLKNVIPVAKRALSGLGQLVKGLTPVIINELPGFVADVLPGFVDAARSVAASLLKAIPRIVGNLFGSLIQRFPTLLNDFFKYITYDLAPKIALALANAFGGGQELYNNIYRWIHSFMIRLQEALSQIIQVMQNVWTVIQPILTAIVQFVQQYILPIVDTAIGFIVNNLDTILTTATIVLAGIAALNIVGHINNVIKSAKLLFAVLKANPIILVVTAVIAAIGYLVHLYKTNDEVRDKINAAWTAIKGFWENTLKPVWEELKKWVIEEALPKIIEKWGELKAAVVDGWKSIVTYWNEKLKPVWDALKKWAVEEGLPQVIELWEKFKTTLSDGWQAIVTFWTETLKPAIQELGDAFQTFLDTYGEPISDWISDTLIAAWEALVTEMKAILDFLDAVFKGKWDKAWDALATAVTTPFLLIVDVLKTPINGIIDMVNNMLQKVTTAVNSVIAKVESLPFISKMGRLEWTPIAHIGEENTGAGFSREDRPGGAGRRKMMAIGGILREGERAIVGEFEPEYLTVQNGRAYVRPSGMSRFGQEIEVPRQTQPRVINVVMTLNDTEIGRAFVPLIDAEQQRVGVKLAKGAV